MCSVDQIKVPPEFRIEAVVTVGGNVYKQGLKKVWGFHWDEDGNIIVRVEPAILTRGDSDCRYRHEQEIVIPWHQVASIDQIEVKGTPTPQCPEEE